MQYKILVKAGNRQEVKWVDASTQTGAIRAAIKNSIMVGSGEVSARSCTGEIVLPAGLAGAKGRIPRKQK